MLNQYNYPLKIYYAFLLRIWCLSPGLMHETGCSGPEHWDDPEGWDEDGGGRGVQDGEHMYSHGWLMSTYDENHYNIVISLQLK